MPNTRLNLRVNLRACWVMATSVLSIVSAGSAAAQTLPPKPADIALLQGVPFCSDKVENGFLTLKADIAYPKARTGPLPVVLFVHGGGYAGGSRTEMRGFIYEAARNNMVGISIDYRLIWQAPYPAQVEDLKCAVRWIRANAAYYKFDPNRIVAQGFSAGTHLTALLGVTADRPELEGKGGYPGFSSRIDAMVLDAGRYDLKRVVKRILSNPLPDSDLVLDAVYALMNGNQNFNAPEYKAASATTYVDPTDPPAFIIHGKADTIAPTTEPRYMHQLLQNNGVASELYLVPDGGHGNYGADEAFYFEKLIAFWKGPPAPPPPPAPLP